jgi:molybdopterin-biosynthesis enzyme MoeA-like protein
VLPDDPAQIADGLLGALGRAPNLILACGGLGPTGDDLTVAAIGAALGLPVEEHPLARTMIRDFYAELHRRGHVTTDEMLPARAKMAQMPMGAEPLRNAVGAAPGVLLARGVTAIVCMPGVPAEMKDIFTNSLAPRLPAFFGSQTYRERIIKTDAWDESILAPAVDSVAARHPLVYVKSRAQVYGGGAADFVTLAARGANEAEAVALLDAAERDLRNALRDIGIETM